MSTFWTPSGEVPIGGISHQDENIKADSVNKASKFRSPNSEKNTDQIDEKAAREFIQQLVDAPALEIIISHVNSLLEILALKLSVDKPSKEETKVLIDVLDGIKEGLKKIEGEKSKDLCDALEKSLSNIKLKWVTL